MSEQLLVESTPETHALNDTQLEQFFESGGELPIEEAPAPLEAQEKTEPLNEEIESQETKGIEEKIERNYKVMAHEEREKRRELQQQLQKIQQESEAKIQRLEQAFQRVLQQPVTPPPSFDENPLDALKYGQDRTEQTLQQLQQIEMQRRQQEQAYSQQQKFISEYHAKAQEYEKEAPDFKDAYKFIVESKLSEFREAGYSLEQAKQLLAEDETAIVAKAFNDGVNPAERIYKLAKLRGYSVAPKSTQLNAQEKITQLEKGVQASKSLSTSGGKSEVGLTLEAVAAMSDEEFDKVDWEKLVKKYG